MGSDLFNTMAKVTKVVKKLHSGKSLGVDEIHPDYLRSLDVVVHAPCHNAQGVAEWVVGLLKRRGGKGLFQLKGDHTSQSPGGGLSKGTGEESLAKC